MRRCFQCLRHFEGNNEEREYYDHMGSKEHQDNRSKKLDPEEQALIDKYN
ncbi:MAG TPA: hypothetical protein VF077_09680 [Nitrospiraceae bacterium]